jgi:hypothetical protein
MRRIVRSLFVVAAALLSDIAQAQRITVSGTVRDSIAGAPLAGAIVQLVADSANSIPRMAVSDSTGRYRIDDVVPGRYIISFLHPLLDSLTLEPILHSLAVAGDRAVTYNLATPAGSRLRNVFCGSTPGGVVVGVVRDSRDGQPLAGASVTAEWVDLVIARGGMMNSPSSRVATTNANGWFALCGVPGPGNLSVHASRGADSTDRIDVSVPSGLFARRELFLGASPGNGILRGRVVNANGAALGGAIVSVARGLRTRTDGDGEWSLEGVPFGTRILDVRAIGYYPDRRPVDVLPSMPSVLVRMATFESVLDTMKISASMLRGADEGGFEQRRRSSGSGRFLTEQDIRRRAPTEISDIFKSVSGVYHTPDGINSSVKMRSAFGSFGGGDGRCDPNVFIDGNSIPAAVSDLDGWLRPTDISSIEVYPDAPPPQFQVALSGCGSIVIWTKRRTSRGRG